MWEREDGDACQIYFSSGYEGLESEVGPLHARGAGQVQHGRAVAMTLRGGDESVTVRRSRCVSVRVSGVSV